MLRHKVERVHWRWPSKVRTNVAATGGSKHEHLERPLGGLNVPEDEVRDLDLLGAHRERHPVGIDTIDVRRAQNYVLKMHTYYATFEPFNVHP